MPIITPRPSDVATLDGIIAAMYDVICGPAGQPRDWNRFRSLYLEGARLIPIPISAGEPFRPRLLTPEDYIRRVQPIFAVEDFGERETHRETQTFGHVAHVLSTYESSRTSGGAPFDSDKNSIQLMNDGARWWIVNVMWNTPRTE
jgi:hypothetical protein